jgi:hypothetical protein
MKANSTSLYTEEQIKYVNDIIDEDLRSHLLHQLRLKDLITNERNELQTAYDNLVIKFKRNYSNGIQPEYWDKLKKDDIIILNSDTGNFKPGDKFIFKMCDGITIVIKPIEMKGIGLEDSNCIYLDRASLLMFHTVDQWG